MGEYHLVWQGDPGMQPGGTVGTDLIRVIEWGQAGSDALKPYRIVGYRGIVEGWRAEYLCVSGVIVNKCLLFFWFLHLSTPKKHIQILHFA